MLLIFFLVLLFILLFLLVAAATDRALVAQDHFQQKAVEAEIALRRD